MACPPTDDERVSQAIREAEDSLPVALATCAKLRLEASRDSCELMSVQAAPRATLYVDACGTIGNPKAKDECIFQAAEAALGRGELEVAIGTCARTNVYRRDCAEHVWTYMHAKNPAVVDEVIEMLREAMPDLAGALAADERGMKGKLLRAELKRQNVLSNSLCEPETREICEGELAGLLRRRWIVAASQMPLAKEELCRDVSVGRLPDPTNKMPSRPDLIWEPAPNLDEAIRKVQAEVCESR